MSLDPFNLLYSAIIPPIVLVSCYFLMKLDKVKNRILYLAILTLLLFAVRIFLVPFAESIGIMPILNYEIIFYTLLAIFGVIFTILYVLRVEDTTLQDLGWKSMNLQRLWEHIFLFCMFPSFSFHRG